MGTQESRAVWPRLRQIKAAPPRSQLHSESSSVPSVGSFAGGRLISRAARSLRVSPCFPAVSMKAFSPVRSVRKNSLSDHSLGISRSKTPVDDPMSLLYNMNDCYSKLKELVPSIPQNKKVSKMEILQHVIDYILDLQIALDSHPTIVSLHHPRPGQSQASRTPLTTLNTDISILSLQASEFPSEFMSNDSKALCG
ncbi:DNA-binding protein inhibitor ID-2 [Sturnira hondurensis]|uniref:DNA-binding protein inhibitor ID-2 n=1 Tax=Sturnira hondurensis TaxID=192404 RepID=UPI0018790DF6|nr:DNA-binding protein inhibitor ID-2 [Sturnira hondurensis]